MPVIPSGTVADPVHVNLASGGGGGGDATAANQTLQITQETAINSALGTAVASPAANTVLDRLKSLLTGTVLAAGANIIGRIGVDQTTPGTTDSVTVKASEGIGSLTESAPANDTASAGLNGRLQRISQRLTSLIAYFLPITTATLSNVSASVTSVTLLASNANRRRVVIVNDSTSALYVKFGATASATSYTYFLAAGDTYESPVLDKYTGIIDGIWAAANGAARITECV